MGTTFAVQSQAARGSRRFYVFFHYLARILHK